MEVQQAGGVAVLDALIAFEFDKDEELHPEEGSVWELTKEDE